MVDKSQVAYYFLWMAHPVLHLTLGTVMLRRQLYRKFPVFFAYVVAQILTFALIFPVYLQNHHHTFFYVYWTSTAVSVVLGFKVIHEVFVDVFRPFHTLKDLGSVLFRWAGLVMVLVAIVVAVSSESSDQPPVIQAILTGQRCVRIIQCGMVLFLLLFSRYLGVNWRQRSFGIALGFGLFSAVELLLLASWSGSHLYSSMTMDLINMVTYNIAILVWLRYMLAECPVRENATALLATHRWEQSLTDLQHPVPADSLIPMFEGMVDRAFSRTRRPEPEPPASSKNPPAAPSVPADNRIRVGSFVYPDLAARGLASKR